MHSLNVLRLSIIDQCRNQRLHQLLRHARSPDLVRQVPLSRRPANLGLPSNSRLSDGLRNPPRFAPQSQGVKTADVVIMGANLGHQAPRFLYNRKVGHPPPVPPETTCHYRRKSPPKRSLDGAPSN